MNYEVKYELDNLKKEVETGQVTTGKFSMFFDESGYEDDYSGNEIFEMQDEFLHYAEMYLRENHSGKYAIQRGGYAIVVITKEHFDNISWKIGWEVC